MSQTTTITTIITTSLLYSSLVFGTGFICGAFRVTIVQPYLGDRRAQLLEMPIMFLAIWKSAQFIVERLRSTTSPVHLQKKKVAVKHVLGKGKKHGKVVVEKRKKGERVGGEDTKKSVSPSWVYWILGAFSFIQILGLEVGWYLFLHREEHKGVGDWLRDKDPVAGTAFLGILLVFGLLPGLMGGLKDEGRQGKGVKEESDDGGAEEDPIILS